MIALNISPCVVRQTNLVQGLPLPRFVNLIYRHLLGFLDLSLACRRVSAYTGQQEHRKIRDILMH
jgi:hypothetical protein